MNYEKLDKLQKYYKDKYGENAFQISEYIKPSSYIEDVKIQAIEEERNGYSITKPKRETSLFRNCCKHCNSVILSNMDFAAYYKHNYCYKCAVTLGEM